jgi:hypothetical protein
MAELRDPIADEIELQRAVVDYYRGRYEDALVRLDRLDSSNSAAAHYRALSLLKLGRAEEAAAEFESLGLQGDALAECSGLAQFHLAGFADDLAAATGPADPAGEERVSFDQPFDPLRDAPDPWSSYSAAQARRQDLRAADTPPERRWDLSLLTAYEFDSNVPQAPRFSGLGSGFRREDSRAVAAAFGEWRAVQREQLNAGLIGSAFGNFHFSMQQFDLQNYMGGAYANAATGDFILGFNYQFHDTLMGGQQLAQDHRLVPSITYREGDFGHTTTFYEFDTAVLNGPFLVPAQVRSGDVHAIGLTQAIYTFEGRGRLYAGYRYEEAFAAGSDFDRQTHMVTGRIEVPLGQRWICDAEVRQFWDDYLRPNSLDFFDRPRVDRRTEVRAGLQWYFGERLSQRLDYTFVNNDSNVANLFGVRFFDYDRHILSTQLILDF